jgi:hypothetical protein
VTRRDATTAVRRNMPDPVPVMVLARLAVDLRARGRRLGGALLRDAWQRCELVSREAGVRAMLAHPPPDADIAACHTPARAAARGPERSAARPHGTGDDGILALPIYAFFIMP